MILLTLFCLAICQTYFFSTQYNFPNNGNKISFSAEQYFFYMICNALLKFITNNNAKNIETPIKFKIKNQIF